MNLISVLCSFALSRRVSPEARDHPPGRPLARGVWQLRQRLPPSDVLPGAGRLQPVRGRHGAVGAQGHGLGGAALRM